MTTRTIKASALASGDVVILDDTTKFVVDHREGYPTPEKVSYVGLWYGDPVIPNTGRVTITASADIEIESA